VGTCLEVHGFLLSIGDVPQGVARTTAFVVRVFSAP
jgi:hypothetical protein